MKNSMKCLFSVLPLTIVIALGLTGCATTQSRVIETPTVQGTTTIDAEERVEIAVGNFVNRSSFQNGIFSGGVDRLGSQAKTTLLGHLQQTNCFIVVDRENMDMLAREAEMAGEQQNLTGARYVITGDITEFGRKEVGDKQLFGILGKGKSQVAYSKVTLNVVDVTNSRVVFSVSGAGEYSLSNREIIGFGGTSGYDATLNGKVIDLSIREAVSKLVDGLQTGAWKTAPGVK